MVNVNDLNILEFVTYKKHDSSDSSKQTTWFYWDFGLVG